MALPLDSLRNNFEVLKIILDNCNFFQIVKQLRKSYPYNIDGKALFKEFQLPNKARKQSLIAKYLETNNLKFEFSKRDRLFSLEKYYNKYLMYYHLEIDEISVGAHFGIYYDDENIRFLLFGGQLDLLLKNLYHEQIDTYRYCALNDQDVINITSEVLHLCHSIFDEFIRHIEEK